MYREKIYTVQKRIEADGYLGINGAGN